MRKELWERVKTLIEEISEASGADRELLLRELSDEERKIVDRLLPHYGEGDEAEQEGLAFGDLREGLLQHTFEPGDVLQNRFEILRFLGEGGMGEVYEANDRALGKVAIKTLLPELAMRKDTVESFQREVMRGRQVAHRNVCRIHDYFELDADGTVVPFFTMEILSGRTLGEEIRERGGLREAEADAIAQELCEGLQAVHEVGIVHGDFKCGNVILTTAPDGSRTVKMTDFGLAQLAPWRETVEASPLERIAGTKQYLAAEIMDGGPKTSASDIFALGVVLFHLRTGRHPFDPRADMAQALEERSRPPSERDLTLEMGGRWARAVALCLARYPEERPKTAREVAVLLRGDGKGIVITRRALVGGFGAALVGGGGWLIWNAFHPGWPPGKIRTLVAEFPIAGESVALGRAVRNLVRLSLQQSHRIELVSSADVQAQSEQTGTGGQPLRGAYAEKIAEQTRARALIRGQIKPDGSGGFNVSLEGKDLANAGNTFGPLEFNSQLKDLPKVVRQLTQRFVRAIGGEEMLAQIGSLGFDEVDTERHDAFEMLTEGVALLYDGDEVSAFDKLREATRVDPNFAMAWAYLGTALVTTLREEAAIQPLERARALKDRLNDRQSMYVEFAYLLLTGDWVEAQKKIQALARMYPMDANLQRQVAHNYLLMEQPELGLAPAKKSVELDPENAVSWDVYLTALANVGQRNEARARWREAAEHFRGSIIMGFSEHGLLMEEEAFREAEALARKGLQARPDSAMWREMLVRPLMQSGRLDEAIQEISQALPAAVLGKRDQVVHQYRFWLGQLGLVRDDRKLAAEQANFLAEVAGRPWNLNALRFGAELGWLSGTRSAVEATAAKLRAAESEFPESSRGQGMAKLGAALAADCAGRTDLAMEQMEASLPLWSDFGANFLSGELLRRHGRFEPALARFEKAVAAKATALNFFGPNTWVRSLAGCALCLDAMGKPDEAAKHWAQFEKYWGSRRQYNLDGFQAG